MKKAVFLATFVLAGCGGGSKPSPAPETTFSFVGPSGIEIKGTMDPAAKTTAAGRKDRAQLAVKLIEAVPVKKSKSKR